MAAQAITAVKKYATISDLARKYSVSLRTLRFYEDKGLLQPLRQGQMRLYTTQDEIRLQLIIKGKRFGLSLRCIEDLLGGRREHSEGEPAECAELIELLDRTSIQEQLSALQMQRARVDDAICELECSLQARDAVMAVA